MKKSAVLVVFLFFFGCSSVAQLKKEWLGKDQSMLIAMKGTPDKVMSDGFGGQIYTYIAYSTYPDIYGAYNWPHHGWPYYGYRHGYGYYHQVAAETGKTMFWIDPYEKIYKVSVSY